MVVKVMKKTSMEWLSELIAFDTTSRHSNLTLIHSVMAWLQQQNIICRLTHNADQTKANLLATIPATNGSLQEGLIFSGHTDVVPVDGQAWDSDPFVATRRNDRIYGRGSCDMKGFIAVILALVPEWQQLTLKRPIHLALSYDEEVGCLGAPHLIADLMASGIKPRACIVGEPTGMRPVVAHKGIHVFRCRFTGLAAHSSLTPDACNAIDYAAEFIVWLRQLAERLRQHGPQDNAYAVPFTSLSTNLIHGGNAVNTVPAQSEFCFEFRNIDQVDPNAIKQEINEYLQQQLLPKMQRDYAQANITLENLASVPSLITDNRNPLLPLLCSLTRESVSPKARYATEAGLFQQAHIPTIVCGPGHIDQAHRANEFIAVEQMVRCEQVMRELVE